MSDTIASNVIYAIYNLVTRAEFDLSEVGGAKNRANAMGDALEYYIKNLFADTFDMSESDRMKKWTQVFSYFGNNSNPPDAMLWNGDAIEIKKLESDASDIALNSSHPKDKLRASSDMITEACRNAENWTEKDMLYCIGTVKGRDLRRLAMVYGSDYCASEQTYLRIKQTIHGGLAEIPGIELAPTKELGRINRVDPLGITYLRVRGMWGIGNPFRVFDYVYTPKNSKFAFMCLISRDKYDSFDNCHLIEDLVGKAEGFRIEDVQVKNPNNPARLRDAKLIVFER